MTPYYANCLENLNVAKTCQLGKIKSTKKDQVISEQSDTISHLENAIFISRISKDWYLFLKVDNIIDISTIVSY